MEEIYGVEFYIEGKEYMAIEEVQFLDGAFSIGIDGILIGSGSSGSDTVIDCDDRKVAHKATLYDHSEGDASLTDTLRRTTVAQMRKRRAASSTSSAKNITAGSAVVLTHG